MLSNLTQAFGDQLIMRGGLLQTQRHFSNDTYLCGILPKQDLIQPDDVIYGGIAMLLSPDEISAEVKSFSVRQVCSNGMVSPQSTQEKTTITSEEELISAFDKVEESLQSGALNRMASRFRQSQSVDITEKLPVVALHVYHTMIYSENQRTRRRDRSQLRAQRITQLRLADLMETERSRPVNQSRSHEPYTLFELVNAVTDFSKEVRDPRAAWRIMELGGRLLENINAFSDQKYAERVSRNSEPDLVF